MRKTFIDFPERLSWARRSMNLSRKEFGAKVGLSIQTIANYERGRCKPRLPHLHKISAVTGRSVAWFTETEAPK